MIRNQILAGACGIAVVTLILFRMESSEVSGGSFAGAHQAVEQTAEHPLSAPAVTQKESPVIQQTSLTPREMEIARQARYEILSDNVDYPTLSMRLEEIHARRDRTVFTPDQLLTALTDPEMWQEDDSAALGLPLTDQQRHDGRAFVRFNPSRLEALVPGDRLELVLPAYRQPLEVAIQSVEVTGDNTVTWRGKLADFEDEDHEMVFSRGEHLTVGGISTPYGYFVLQAHDDAGWIAAASDLGRQSPGQPDSLFPPINRGGN